MNAAIFANTIRLFNTIQIKNYFLIVEALTELNRHLSFFLNGNYTTPSVYYLKLLQHAICLNWFLMNVFAIHRFFVRNIALAK